MRATLRKWLMLAMVVMPMACAENVDYEFARLRAYFHYDRVNTALPLFHSLQTPGQFCAVYVAGNKLHFHSLTQDLPVDLTQVAYYQSFITLSGFIIGQPNATDMTTGRIEPVAYERACRNCFEEIGTHTPVELRELGMAQCPKCKRIYNLNDNGRIYEGAQGNKLYRYRMTYNGTNVIHIDNR